MAKKRAVWFLIFFAPLSIGMLVWRLFFHDNRPYLQGDVIRLIDGFYDKDIQRSPLKISLKTIQNEALNQGWKILTTLSNGVVIWQTYASDFIVTPSEESVEGSARVYLPNGSLCYSIDLFRKDTAAGRWNFRDDRIFLSAAKGDDPNRKSYFIDYQTFENTGPVRVAAETLQNPVFFGWTTQGRAARRLMAYSLRYSLWARTARGVPIKTVVRQKGRSLSYRLDPLEQVGFLTGKALPIFPPAASSSGKPLMLVRSSDRLMRRIKVSPGPYILRLVARASLAGSQPPLLIIKKDGREIVRQPIESESWKTFYFRALVKDGHAEFSAEYANDYFDPETGRDRNIFILRMDLCPDPSPGQSCGRVEKGDAVSPTWSWLEGSEADFNEVLPSGKFMMFSSSDVYTLRRFFRPGIAAFLVTARADLAGPESPRLAFYLDKKRIGALEIASTTFHQYELESIPLTEGQHELKIVFENDFYDPQARQDRNIILTEIGLRYASAVVISDPLEQPSDGFIISYATTARFRNQLRLCRDFVAKEAGRINGIARRIDRASDVRNALICPPQTNLNFRIVVPPGGKLTLSLGADFPVDARGGKPGGVGLVIRAREAFHAAQTIFAEEITPSNTDAAGSWKDRIVDLAGFTGKKLELSFETQGVAPESLVSPSLFIGNPVITSDSSRIPKEPNIVLIAADALRADHLGCYGYYRKTSPSIDQLAGESIVFEDAVSQSSWTLPSFASLFTSLYPSFHGANVWDSRLLPSEATLPKTLKKAGYATAASVNNAFLDPVHGLSEGFDSYDFGNFSLEAQLQAVIQQLNSLRNQKFFIFVHFLAPHSPYRAPQPFCSTFGRPDYPKLDTSNNTLHVLETSRRRLSNPEREYIISQYDGAILYLDSIIKKLLDYMKQQGLYQNTLIIFLADHGEQFQEHGHLIHGSSLYQEEIHVPLMMKLPTGTSLAPRRFPGVVRTIDIVPTILDLVHLPLPYSFQGRSLIPPLLRNLSENPVAFAELNTSGLLAIRKDQYKFISGYPAMDSGANKEVGPAESQAMNTEELYDLKKDPKETHNLTASRPDLVTMFHKERMTFLDFASSFRQKQFGSREANRFVLNAADLERLKALGYIR